jgi:hypothetical protein
LLGQKGEKKMIFVFVLGILCGAWLRTAQAKRVGHASATFLAAFFRHHSILVAFRVTKDHLWREKVGLPVGSGL